MTGNSSKTGAFGSLSERVSLPAWVSAACLPLDCSLPAFLPSLRSWMAWDMCNQDSVWSDLEVSRARRGRPWVPAAAGPWARRGTGRTAEAAHFANKSLSYLNSTKFAILRLLCDALSKSKLSSCHQYSISCSWKLFSCASGSLSRHMQYLCSKILIWIGVWSGVSSGVQWPGWKNAMFI